MTRTSDKRMKTQTNTKVDIKMYDDEFYLEHAVFLVSFCYTIQRNHYEYGLKRLVSGRVRLLECSSKSQSCYLPLIRRTFVIC